MKQLNEFMDMFGNPVEQEMSKKKSDILPPGMLARAKAAEEKMKEAGVKPKRTNPYLSTLVQLPLWPETVRGAPNVILRSALFCARRRTSKDKSEHVRDHVVQCAGGIVIKHTGPILVQGDLTIWEQCLHLARECGLGNPLKFTRAAFLKSIDLAANGDNYALLHQSFNDLAASKIEIQPSPHNKGYFGTLLSGSYDENGNYEITIDPRIVQLFETNTWTGVSWSQRLRLQKKPLAMWLHGFYSTHKKPFDMHAETIRGLSGSNTKSLAKFEQQLKAALLDLQEITGWTCALTSGKVSISKTKAIAQ